MRKGKRKVTVIVGALLALWFSQEAAMTTNNTTTTPVQQREEDVRRDYIRLTKPPGMAAGAGGIGHRVGNETYQSWETGLRVLDISEAAAAARAYRVRSAGPRRILEAPEKYTVPTVYMATALTGHFQRAKELIEAHLAGEPAGPLTVAPRVHVNRRPPIRAWVQAQIKKYRALRAAGRSQTERAEAERKMSQYVDYIESDIGSADRTSEERQWVLERAPARAAEVRAAAEEAAKGTDLAMAEERAAIAGARRAAQARKEEADQARRRERLADLERTRVAAMRKAVVARAAADRGRARRAVRAAQAAEEERNNEGGDEDYGQAATINGGEPAEGEPGPEARTWEQRMFDDEEDEAREAEATTRADAEAARAADLEECANRGAAAARAEAERAADDAARAVAEAEADAATARQAAETRAAAEAAQAAADAAQANVEATRMAAEAEEARAAAAAATAAATATAEAEAAEATAAAQAERDARQREAQLNEAREAAARARPDLPPTLDRESGELEAKVLRDPRAIILAVPWAVRSPFEFVTDVIGEHQETWAAAFGGTRGWVVNAQGEEERDMALRWAMMIHALLLRLPTAQRQRPHKAIERRMAAWRDGNYTWLVDEYLKDLSRVKSSPPRKRSEEAIVSQAVAYISEGLISKAVGLLESNGLGDLLDPRIVAQLKAKHPKRKEPMPSRLPDRARPRLELKLGETFRKAARKSGTGPNNLKNEHLTALTRDFRTGEAAGAIEKCEAYAEMAVNGELPAYYYWVETATQLVATIKKFTEAGPDVRPLAMGNVESRAWASALADANKGLFRDALEPVQVAVGTEGGVSLHVFTMRAITELHPGFCVAQADKQNAYQELKRKVTMERLEGDPRFHHLSNFFHAFYSPTSDIYLNGVRADFLSEEGGRQGDPMYCGLYSFTTHPETEELARQLSASGGGAMADVDDTMAYGRPADVYPAMRDYGRAVEKLGEKLRADKGRSYSKGLGAGLADVEGFDDGYPVSSDEHGNSGIMVSGIPVGTSAYVRNSLAAKAAQVMERIKNSATMLQPAHLQSLHLCVVMSSAHKLDWWMQHCYPTDVKAMLGQYDKCVLELVAMSHGSDAVVKGALSRARSRLPMRDGGEGVRSVELTAEKGFAGRVCQVIPKMIDRRLSGVRVKGAALPLTPLLGQGSFDDGMEHVRFGPLLDSGSRLGNEFGQAWQVIQAEAGAKALGTILERPAKAAGIGGDGKPTERIQRALTFICEQKAWEDVDSAVRELPARDRERGAWYSRDLFSRQFLSAIPSKSQVVANREWAEMVATYYGKPSPACEAYAGQSVMLNGTRIGQLDKYGDTLLSDSRLSNRDGARTLMHNSIENAMAGSMSAAGLDFRVEPEGMFDAMLPPEGRQRYQEDCKSRSQSGIVPDFVIKKDGLEGLYDVKTMVWCITRYRASHLRGDGPSAMAVQVRADAVSPAYRRHAAIMDENYANTPRDPGGHAPEGAPGPVLRKLMTYGVVQGLVVGAFSEVSDAVHKLAKRCAKGMAVKHWREMLARTKEDAEAALLGRVRREWAITIGREMARLKVDQLDKYVRGPTGRAAAAAKRTSEREYFKWRHSAYTEHGGYGAGFFGVPDRRRA